MGEAKITHKHSHIQSEGRRKGELIACFAEQKMLGNQESDSLRFLHWKITLLQKSYASSRTRDFLMTKITNTTTIIVNY